MSANPVGLVVTGTTIVFTTSSFAAKIISATQKDMKRKSISTTNFSSIVAESFIPGKLYDPGTLEMDFIFEPDVQPPIAGVAETCTVTFPVPTGKASGASMAGSCFNESWQWSGQVEDKYMAKASFKFSGALTWVASA